MNTSQYHFHEFHPWEVLQLLLAAGFRHLERALVQQWEGPAIYHGNTPANLLTGPIEASESDLLTMRYLHPVALLMRKDR